MTNTPQEVIAAAKFLRDNDEQVKRAKETLLNYTKENGTVLDHENDLKIQRVVRQLTSLNKDEMTDYRKDKVIAGMKINRANVLDYAKSEDLKKAGYTAETTPELFTVKESESVKITSIPLKERE